MNAATNLAEGPTVALGLMKQLYWDSFANTFEEQINTVEDKNLIPYFYNDNIFFSDSFELSSELSTENLKSSLAIYYSVVVSIPESYLMAEAQFRLGEIQFKIIEIFNKIDIGYII